MSKTATTITTIVILVILSIAFYFYAPESWKFWQGETQPAALGAVPGDETGENPAPHETITAKHQFKNGIHIIAGEANVPTPCHLLTTIAGVAESFPEQVTIDFAATSSADVCAQTITPVRFKVEFQASAE